jgi:hypothetical protein
VRFLDYDNDGWKDLFIVQAQVHKLKERGFTVECIHSGRDRETSCRVCSEYLSRKL